MFSVAIQMQAVDVDTIGVTDATPLRPEAEVAGVPPARPAPMRRTEDEDVPLEERKDFVD